MSIMLENPPQRTSLGVGFSANRGRTGNAQAWRQQIGGKQVPARLALLPESKTRWDRVGLSAVLQVSILIFFVLVPLLYPQKMKTVLEFGIVQIAQPITEIPVAPPPPPPPQPK